MKGYHYVRFQYCMRTIQNDLGQVHDPALVIVSPQIMPLTKSIIS
jgi:hypothetical protein